MVRAPTPQEEDRRRVCRERKTVTAERIEHVNRIKGLLFAQGISDYEPLLRKRRERLEELRTGDGRPIPEHLKAQIGRELDRFELILRQIKSVETERDVLLRPSETRRLAKSEADVFGDTHVRPKCKIFLDAEYKVVEHQIAPPLELISLVEQNLIHKHWL